MSAPAASVVVPTYGRPERLAACLEALAAQEPPPGGFEVVVVDDGSPVPAEAVARPFASRLALTVVRQGNAGPAAARNAGAAAAAGALLAFTDDDCAPAPGWLQALAEAARQNPGALLAGRTVNALPGNPYATASQLLIDYLYEYFAPESGRVPLVASNNLAVPAGAFAAMGGFDAGFPLAAGEDRDLCARWHEAGRPFATVPDAVVAHAHDLTAGGFVRQHLAYGRGAYRYHVRRPSGGLRPEPLAFYTGLVSFPLGQARGVRPLALAGLLAVSQIANVAGYALGALAARPAAGRNGRGRGTPGS